MASFARNPYYDTKFLWKLLLTIALVFGVMKATGGAGFVVVVPFALYALIMNRLELLLFWVVFANSTVATNGFFAPKDFVYGLTFRALLMVVGLYGALQFFSMRSSKYVTPLLGIFIYLLYMFIPSAQGWAPGVSYLKLVLFCSTYMAFAYMATKAGNAQMIDMRKVRSVILALSIVYVFGSVLLLPFPGISLMNAEELLRTGTVVTSLYKGMTNHSQALGMYMCVFTAFLFADLVFHVQKPDKLYIALILCGFFLLFKSSTRTGMGTLLATVLFATYLLFKMRGINIRWKSKVVTGILMIVAVVAVTVLLIPSARAKVVKFAMKYADEGSSMDFNLEYALKTRSFLVEEQMRNFHMKPSIGWGFQVSPQVGEMARHSEGLILTAPVEKGVWVTAILEEGGIFGEILYCTYLLIAVFLLMARKAYMGLTIFVLIHIANLGEFTMFSMSGAGGMWYALLFFALVFDTKRNQAVPNPRRIEWWPVGG